MPGSAVRAPLQCIRRGRLKNFREIIRQYLIEAHVGDDELFLLGVQSDTPRFLDLALGSADEPAWWSVATIIDTPDTDEDTFRFLFLVLSRLRSDNPTLRRLHLNLVDPDNPRLRALDDANGFDITAIGAIEDQKDSAIDLIRLVPVLSRRGGRPGACSDNHGVDWIHSP